LVYSWEDCRKNKGELLLRHSVESVATTYNQATNKKQNGDDLQSSDTVITPFQLQSDK